MTHKEILEKAFMIATNNGFNQRDEEPDIFKIPEAFIYRHDFAKALWGEERVVIIGNTDWRTWPMNFEHHLQQMVIAEDPIKYLGENI